MTRRYWIVLGALAAVSLGILLIPRPTSGSSGAAAPSLQGTILRGEIAPPIAGVDQFGHPASLASFRGRTVVLAFLESRCKQTCPRVADKLRQIDLRLGPGARRVALVAVSTDPEGDSRWSVQHFSRIHGLLHRWTYLTAPRTTLAAVWHAYYVFAAPANADHTLDSAHSSVTYVIDPAGRRRVLMGGDPDSFALEQDVRMLAGLPQSIVLNAVAAPRAGHPAPAFALPSLSTPSIALQSLRGKVVLVNFWATWCTACNAEMPRLASWYRQLQARGLVILGVDSQESRGSAADYARRLQIPYPVTVDADGSVSSEYNVFGLPATFLLDRRGVVRVVHYGVLTPDFLRSQVEPLLKSAA